MLMLLSPLMLLSDALHEANHDFNPAMAHYLYFVVGYRAEGCDPGWERLAFERRSEWRCWLYLITWGPLG